MSTSDRDWVFARRFVIRQMIERGDPTAADRIPDIPEYGALQNDEVQDLRRLLSDFDRYASTDPDYPGSPFAAEVKAALERGSDVPG